MAIMEMLAIGAVVGLIGHLILRQNGYAIIGEMLLASVGAISFGLVAGIWVGMRTFKPEPLIVAAIGAALVMVLLIYVSMRPSESTTAD